MLASAGAVRMSAPLLRARQLRVSFHQGHAVLRALDGVDLEVAAGQTVALVGESGSGKSTAALTLMGLHRPESGTIELAGRDVTHAGPAGLKQLRRRVQIVMQDPYGSLNPRWTVERIIAEPLAAHDIGNREERRARVCELIRQVGLPEDAASRLPTQLSGGQRQRVAIARALASSPSLVIADEPVSALDVSIQAQIINLLLDIQRATGVAFLVISHDIALVHQVANRVIVLYLGRVVEEGPADEVIVAPRHPYTAALVSAVPDMGATGRRRIVLKGEPPSPLSPPTGCAFHPRCPIAIERCRNERPPLDAAGPGRRVACFRPGELDFTPDATQAGAA